MSNKNGKICANVTLSSTIYKCLWCVGSLCSIEYWFRCMDLDGDGVLSMFELEYFYEEQCERMERMGIEPLPFQDLLCQMLDLVKPESAGECQQKLMSSFISLYCKVNPATVICFFAISTTHMPLFVPVFFPQVR